MPSHQDRVRRSYHDIVLLEHTDIKTDEQKLIVSISKVSIASWCTRADMEHMIMKTVQQAIRMGYKDSAKQRLADAPK